MPNQIFTRLIKDKIEHFVSSYLELSRDVFFDPTKKNRIAHPGEFGAYREGLVKEFLQLFVPERLQVGSGFAINASEQVSPQLDIILYDPAVTPKFENSSHQRFFPIESICGVGEVKSILRTKNDLRDALERLWQVKRMAMNVHQRVNQERTKVKVPFSFLFCEKITATPEEVNRWFVEIYKQHDVVKEHWHNVIATIYSGLFKYATMQDITVGSSVIPKNSIGAIPVSFGGILNGNFHLPSKENGTHLISFGHDLVIEFANRTGTAPDIISYTDEYK